jgi:peptidoglycan/LPS O-acetylase OafA/YrhL
VLAVLLFHADIAWAGGGYLGVDVFFVLSGFLITSLLLAELDRHDRIDVRRFWTRRVSRLGPALLVLVTIGTVLGSFIAPQESLAELRGDALATLAQVVNWRLIDTIGHSLVGATRSPFQHCWSLAIEAQFYLLWPLLIMLVTRGRGGRRRNVGMLAATLTALSAIAMVLLVGPGWHTQRSYYGTDTRAQALLVGAVLAAMIGHRLTGQHRPVSPGARLGISAAGTLAIGGLLLAFVAAPTSGHTMYEGWYLAFAIVVAVLLAQLVLAPAGVVPTLLSARPIVGLGRISYSLYLWHWPLFLVITDARTGLSGGSLLAARLIGSVVVAIGSYELVERRFHRMR